MYPLSVIHDVIMKKKGYKYFAELDLTMIYYVMELDEESKELLYDRYQYCRMAMGLKVSPDVASND